MPRPKRWLDDQAARTRRTHAAAVLDEYAAVRCAFRVLTSALEATRKDATRADDAKDRARLVARAEEIALFLDLLTAVVVPTPKDKNINLAESIRAEWDTRWAASRLAACSAWFKEHKANGYPSGAALSDARLAALDEVLSADLPDVLGWQRPRGDLRVLIARAIKKAEREGVPRLAAEFLGLHITLGGKAVYENAKRVKLRGGRVRIPRRLK